MHRPRGQYSFEVIILTLVILYISGITIGTYFDIADSSEAIAILKPMVQSVLVKSSNIHYIQQVDFIKPSEEGVNLEVHLIPESPPLEGSLIQEIEDLSDDIAEKVGFGFVTVRVVYPSVGNIDPVANAGGPYTGNRAESIPISGTGSYDPDGSITTYSWAVNNSGCSIEDPSASTTFLCCQGGLGLDTTIELTVTDNGGGNDLSTSAVTLAAGSGSCPF